MTVPIPNIDALKIGSKIYHPTFKVKAIVLSISIIDVTVKLTSKKPSLFAFSGLTELFQYKFIIPVDLILRSWKAET